MSLPNYPFAESQLKDRLGFKAIASRPNFIPLRPEWSDVPNSSLTLPPTHAVDPMHIEFDRCEQESQKEIRMEVASERTRAILNTTSQIDSIVGKSLQVVKSIAKHVTEHRNAARRSRQLMKDHFVDTFQSDASSSPANASIRAELRGVVGRCGKDIQAAVRDAACSQKMTAVKLCFDSMRVDVETEITDALLRISRTASEPKEELCAKMTSSIDNRAPPSSSATTIEPVVDRQDEIPDVDCEDILFDEAPLYDLNE